MRSTTEGGSGRAASAAQQHGANRRVLRGVGQGLTSDHLDELQGVIGAAQDVGRRSRFLGALEAARITHASLKVF